MQLKDEVEDEPARVTQDQGGHLVQLDGNHYFYHAGPIGEESEFHER